MALMQVYTFPHPVLKQKAKPVTGFDGKAGFELEQLAEDMLETMYEENGIGLAAVQVGVLKRLVVMDVGKEQEPGAGTEHDGEEGRTPDPRVFVNPELLEGHGETITEEGCLSVVEFTAQVKRARSIRVRYQTTSGETQEEAFEGLAAVCLQHEMDHLEGKLFIDHLPPVKKQLVKKRLAKMAQTA